MIRNRSTSYGLKFRCYFCPAETVVWAPESNLIIHPSAFRDRPSEWLPFGGNWACPQCAPLLHAYYAEVREWNARKTAAVVPLFRAANRREDEWRKANPYPVLPVGVEARI